MIAWSLALVACTQTQNVPDDEPEPERGGTTLTYTPPPSRCPPSDTACVDLLSLPLSWRFEGGWTFNWITDLGDLDGNGQSEVGVTFTDAAGEIQHTSVLFAPFDREVMLPSGEDLGLTGTVLPSDLTGDGVLDLLLEGGAILAGPISSTTNPGEFVGAVDPSAMDPLTSWDLLDVDSDGDLDYAVATPEHLDLWTGPWSTWGVEPPTLSLSLSCSKNRAPENALLTAVPDIDLDGVAELWVTGTFPYSEYNDCRWYRLPANLAGVIDVPQAYTPAPPLAVPDPYGDQNGDGVTDFRQTYMGPSGRVYEVLSPPLSEGTEAWSGAVLGTLPAIYGKMPTPFPTSVVGDSYNDLYARVSLPAFASEGIVLVAGGPAGGLFTGEVSLEVLGFAYSNPKASISLVGSFVVGQDELGARLYDLATP